MRTIDFTVRQVKDFGGERTQFEAVTQTEHGRAVVRAPTREALHAFLQQIETQQGRGEFTLTQQGGTQ